MMNLHLLRIFVAVVDEGGVAQAAKALYKSQPGISRAVRHLEAQLGVPLFEKAGRRLRLTTEGTEIYLQAQNISATERAVEDTLAGLKGLRQGVLRIGASTTIATYVLPKYIGAFARLHPNVELRLGAAHTRVLVERLANYELDVALAEAPVDDPSIRVIPWRIDEMVVIAAPGHRLAGRRAIPPGQLDAELFVLREPESGSRTIVLGALRNAGVNVSRIMSIDGTEVIRRVVAEGLGVAVVSRFAVADQLNAGTLTTLDVAGLRIARPFNRLELHRRRPSVPAQTFLALIDKPAGEVKSPRPRARAVGERRRKS